MRFARLVHLFTAPVVLVAMTACGSSSPATTASTASPSTTAVATSGSAESYKSALPDSIKSSGVLRTGGPVTVPPNIFLEADGKTPTGFMYDLANAVAENLGVKLQFSSMPFPALIPGLQADKIDMTITVSDTPERQKTLTFVDFLEDGIVLLVKKGNPENITSLDDLCGKSAAILSGSVAVGVTEAQQKKCAAAGKPAITVKQFNGASDAQLQVRSGNATAFFGGREALNYLTSTPTGGAAFEVAPGGPYTSQPSGFAVPKANTGLRDALKGALQALTDDGTVQSLAAKYGIKTGLYSTIMIDDAK